MEKIQISFNQRGYEKALANYKLYQESIKALNLEAKKLNVTLKLEDIQASSNPYTLIATKHFETLGVDLPNINPIKYLSMTDLDTSDLSTLSNRVQELKKFSKMPLKSDFTVSITDEAQIKRYKALMEVSDKLNEWLKDSIIKNPMGIQRALGSEVIIGTNGKFTPVYRTR